jgi:hypothetical protein
LEEEELKKGIGEKTKGVEEEEEERNLALAFSLGGCELTPGALLTPLSVNNSAVTPNCYRSAIYPRTCQDYPYKRLLQDS